MPLTVRIVEPEPFPDDITEIHGSAVTAQFQIDFTISSLTPVVCRAELLRTEES
jgi:hypothetical protein